jgi:uncharacterized CHY-type Zn-finger protein
MKRDILFLHKKIAVTCKKSMGDVNEYQKLLEPPLKPKKIKDSKKGDLICGQCKKSCHMKKH